jgi:CHAP domain
MKAAVVLVIAVPLMLLALPGIAGAAVAGAVLGGGGGSGSGGSTCGSNGGGNAPPMPGGGSLPPAPGGAVSFQGKTSWFGGPHDPSAGKSTASGLPVSVPGIAAHPPGVDAGARENYDRLGGYWLITFPNQQRAVIQQTDIGPNAANRVVDVTYSALPYVGYSETDYPTDGTVQAAYLGKGPQYAKYAIGNGNQPPPGGSQPTCGNGGNPGPVDGGWNTERGGAPPVNVSALVGGDQGQCTYYAEAAWQTYSDPNISFQMTGNGQDVAANLAAGYQAPYRRQLSPRPGAIVSWAAGYPGYSSAYGHVAYVGWVNTDGSGNITSFTVWEMNVIGLGKTDFRTVPFNASPKQVFFWPDHDLKPWQEVKTLFPSYTPPAGTGWPAQ